MSRTHVTSPQSLPEGQFFRKVESPSGTVRYLPIRRDFIAWLMRQDPTEHPSQHLGELWVEEVEGGWAWVEPPTSHPSTDYKRGTGVEGYAGS